MRCRFYSYCALLPFRSLIKVGWIPLVWQDPPFSWVMNASPSEPGPTTSHWDPWILPYSCWCTVQPIPRENAVEQYTIHAIYIYYNETAKRLASRNTFQVVVRNVWLSKSTRSSFRVYAWSVIINANDNVVGPYVWYGSPLIWLMPIIIAPTINVLH